MAKAWKDVVPVGTHVSPEGVVEVTPQRAEKWTRDVKAIRAAGNKIPVPWGHNTHAIPGPDEYQFLRSRYNAGHVEDARFDAERGMFQCLLDVPAAELDREGNLLTELELPNKTKVKASIGEVSIGFANWTDGQGRKWEDVPIHVALTPLPVFAGQQGFHLATATHSDSAKAVKRFSLSTIVQRLSTGDSTVADETTETTTEAKKPAGGATANKEELLNTIKSDLAEGFGIKLPDSTTTDNFLEHLSVALGAAKHAKEHKEGEDTETTVTPAADQPVIQEDRPITMSTAVSKENNPVLAALWKDKEATVRTNRLARIKRLRDAGLTKDVADQLETQATTVQLALMPDGTMKPDAIDDQIKLVEDTFGSVKLAQVTRASLATATEQPHPSGVGRKSEAEEKKSVDDFCRRNGLPVEDK